MVFLEGKLVDEEAKREAKGVEVHISLESLKRRVEERLNQKVNFCFSSSFFWVFVLVVGSFS